MQIYYWFKNEILFDLRNLQIIFLQSEPKYALNYIFSISFLLKIYIT